jgi:hypothetical protein
VTDCTGAIRCRVIVDPSDAKAFYVNFGHRCGKSTSVLMTDRVRQSVPGSRAARIKPTSAIVRRTCAPAYQSVLSVPTPRRHSRVSARERAHLA